MGDSVTHPLTSRTVTDGRWNKWPAAVSSSVGDPHPIPILISLSETAGIKRISYSADNVQWMDRIDEGIGAPGKPMIKIYIIQPHATNTHY